MLLDFSFPISNNVHMNPFNLSIYDRLNRLIKPISFCGLRWLKVSKKAVNLNKEASSLKQGRGFAADLGGWTLIELLIVIVLLGVLVVISIQALADARSSTREASANAMVRVLNQASKRAYLANESPFIQSPVTNPLTTNTVISSVPTAFIPPNNADAIYWYMAKGLVLPTEVNTNLFDLIERHPVTFSLDGDGTGIWRRVP
jgi:prepilin-type N-terminal cleavage/methylation domain-containing protein